MRVFLITSLVLFFMMSCCHGEESTISQTDNTSSIVDEIEENAVEFEKIQEIIDKSGMTHIELKEIIKGLLNGELKFEDLNLLDLIQDQFMSELRANIKISGKIILICILGAVIKLIGDGFGKKQVADVGNFTMFIMIMTYVLATYKNVSESASNLLGQMNDFTDALAPSLITLTAFSGGSVTTVAFCESIIMLTGIVNKILQQQLLPFLYVLLILAILNAISDENIMSKLLGFLKKLYEWTLKGILFCFIAFMGLNSLITPIADGLITRTAKNAIGIIPVVGSGLTEISDFVIGCGAMVKNAFGIGVMISVVIMASVPFIEAGVTALLYKAMAIVTEPIGDKRLNDSLSEIGDILLLLMGTIATSVLLFISAVAIMIYLTNETLFLR